MRTSNPVLKDDTFDGFMAESTTMTLEGTAWKSLLLTMIVMVSGGWAYQSCMEKLVYLEPEVIEEAGKIATLSHVPGSIIGMALGGALVGFVIALITIFNPKASPLTSGFYAVAEGVSLGSFSTIFEYMYPGAVPVSIGITFGILFSLLAAYALRLVNPTENFKLGVVAATGGIAFFYLVAIGLGFFGIEMPLLHETGPAGILLSAFIVVVAALNLVLDFDFIESGVEKGAPKYMEWYASFGLLVTLVWLYLEVLKFVIKVMAAMKGDD